MADGYFNRPEQTAANFIPHPFASQKKARLYKTGDRARYLIDGNLEFLGRTDDQIKIRGVRTHLGAVEAALREHTAVRDALVVPYQELSDSTGMVAYWVAKPGATLPEDALRRFLRERLPEQMVPSVFVPLAALPMTPSGKVDRQALPVPGRAHAERQSPLAAPRHNLELRLTKIWEDVLSVQPIGVKDNFFDLGGHSLLAVRLFAAVEKTFGKRIPLASLFKAPTVEQLARLLVEQNATGLCSSLVAIQPGGSRPPLFFVHAHSGEILFYRDLSQHLGPNQPFFGLQARSVHGGSPHYTIEAMAADYVTEIRSVQREGPYCVGGYCFGGLVAFEMAQQLKAEGQEVALVAMLDTLGPGPHVPWGFPERVDRSARKIRFHLEMLRSLGAKEKLVYLQKIMQKIIMKRICRIALKYYARHGRSLPRVLENAAEINLWVAKNYVPKLYPGHITICMSSEMFRQFPSEPTFGWGSVAAGGVTVHEIPGNPDSALRDPSVGILAERINSYLDKVANQNQVDFRSTSPPYGPTAQDPA